MRWTGQVVPRYSETYTFYTIADDGTRLWVDGTHLIDDWNDHGAEERSGTIALTAGQPYSLTLEYYDNGGGALVALDWHSDSQTRERVPQDRLWQPGATPALPLSVTTKALIGTRSCPLRSWASTKLRSLKAMATLLP